MSLYNKYRPKDFDEIVGNEDIVEALQTMLDKEDIPHCFLFTGQYGCGKTTFGYLLANYLNCQGTDFREVDSAHFGGVADIREMRRNARLMPLEGETRIWLYDECHKLTGDAQHALLKVLEHPPKHCYFIFSTTDPQKLISQLKDRCQQFEVKLLDEIQLRKLLKRITHAENEKLPPDVYDMIIESSLGHPRSAIQILEKVLSVPKEKRLKTAKVATDKKNQSIDLCRALIKKAKWIEVRNILQGLKDQEPEDIRRVVLGYCKTVLLNEENDIAALIIEEFWEPFYNTGFPGLVYACYSVTKSK